MMETIEDTSLQERHLFSAVFGDQVCKEGRQITHSIHPVHLQRVGSSHSTIQRPCLGKSPREVLFFKLLYSEFKKVTEFFDQALLDLSIREAGVREDLANVSTRLMDAKATELCVSLSKTIYCLYKDLLLLETYAIMSYCGFSKILKKKDKCTGLPTRAAFMAHFVDRSNFANYPTLLNMIRRCQFEYEEVSRQLSGQLLDDQRLFIDMILKMNVDAAGVAAQEGGRHTVPSTPVQLQVDQCELSQLHVDIHEALFPPEEFNEDDEDEDDDLTVDAGSDMHFATQTRKRMKL